MSFQIATADCLHDGKIRCRLMIRCRNTAISRFRSIRVADLTQAGDGKAVKTALGQCHDLTVDRSVFIMRYLKNWIFGMVPLSSAAVDDIHVWFDRRSPESERLRWGGKDGAASGIVKGLLIALALSTVLWALVAYSFFF